METRTYSFVDKSTWGDGEWQNEPDKIQWQDQETDLPCLAVRNPYLGHWCGYVGITESHPLFNVDYSSCPQDCGEYWCGHTPDSLLDAHGGITFSNLCQEDEKEHGICHVPAAGESDKVWWFGFDCAHYGDRSPGMTYSNQGIYRTLEYIKAQCSELARQLKAYSLPLGEL